MKKENILVVAAHPDDEVLGCGGTLLKLSKNNNINICFLTDGESARKIKLRKISTRKRSAMQVAKKITKNKPIFLNYSDNQLDKIPLLKIIKKIEKIFENIKPSVIFTHTSNCLNIDHKICNEVVNVVCRPVRKFKVKKILGFEILSSTEWNFKNTKFNPNYFVNITKHFNGKLRLMKLYKNEMKKFPHSRSKKGIESLGHYRGIISGYKFAEAFELIKFIDD